MWHFSSSVRAFPQKVGLVLGSVSAVLLPQSLPGGAFSTGGTAIAQTPPNAVQTEPPAPTVRFARGENVGLEEIVSEWRGYYADVPVYQCVCQSDICDQTSEWPYRVFDRYQLSVALGPNNGKAAEQVGFNCFDIADGSRPTDPRRFSAAERDPNEPVAAAPARIPAPPIPAPPSVEAPQAPDPIVPEPEALEPVVEAPVAPPAAPVSSATQNETPSAPPSATPDAIAAAPTQAASGAIPTATAIDNGAAIRLDWPSGRSDVIAVANSNWNLNVLGAVDCQTASVVDEKVLEAQRVIGRPAVDSATGNVAVPVLLESCLETDQSAVFVVDPNEGGGYSLYRSQLPGEQVLPNEFSTYSFSSITGVQYWDGYLLVRQANAAGTEAVSFFLPANSPAGVYGGCGVVRDGEGASVLCRD